MGAGLTEPAAHLFAWKVALFLWNEVRSADLRLALADLRAVEARKSKDPREPGDPREPKDPPPGFDLDPALVEVIGDTIRELYTRFRGVDFREVQTRIEIESQRAIDRLTSVVDAGPTREQRQGHPRGGCKDLILAALDSLMAKGEWGKTEAEIYRHARVGKATFYRYRRDDTAVQAKLSSYRQKSHGRNPPGPSEV
jgi:hypothetical protein